MARATADRSLPEILYEDLCFDAQQATEKAIKALLVDRKIPFPRTHAITELLTLLEQGGLEVPQEIRQAGVLTSYAVETRYPALSGDVTEEEYLEAVTLAENVVRWAEGLITARPDREMR